jgi:hypothetical protein
MGARVEREAMLETVAGVVREAMVVLRPVAASS